MTVPSGAGHIPDSQLPRIDAMLVVFTVKNVDSTFNSLNDLNVISTQMEQIQQG